MSIHFSQSQLEKFDHYPSEVKQQVLSQLTQQARAQHIDIKQLANKVILSGPSTKEVEMPSTPSIAAAAAFILAKKVQVKPFEKYLWKHDATFCQHMRAWLQERLLNASEEVSNDMREFYIYNLLSYLPFFYPQETITIPIQGRNIDFTIERIELTSSKFGSPMVAYGLTPRNEEANPILLFKGTTFPADEGMFWSVLTDLNPWAPVGSFAFELSGKEKIEAWLKQAKRKVTITGISLGGSLALLTASTFPHYIQTVYAYNCPAMNSTLIKRWNAFKGEKPEVNVLLQTRKDPISRNIGCCWAEDWNILHVDAPVESAFQAHAAACTGHPHASIIPGNASVENQRLLRRLWPFFSLLLTPLFIVGVILSPFVMLVHAIIRLAGKLFR